MKKLKIVLLILAEIFAPPFLVMTFIIFFTPGPILWAPTIIFAVFIFIIYHSVFNIVSIINDRTKIFEDI